MIPESKICAICGLEKSKDKFAIRSKPNGYTWLRAECKVCNSTIRRDRYNNMPHVRQMVLSKNQKYVDKNKQKKRAQEKEWRIKNRHRLSQLSLIKYYKKFGEDINYRIERSLRARVYFAMQSGVKCDGTMALVGCNIETLKKHIESLFIDGMNWGNYGVKGWHIDHIKPCASFDLSTEEGQRECFSYKNLQPLWWSENLKKGAKIGYCS